MLVIEGSNGKSLVLAEKIKEWNQKQTIIIDKVGLTFLPKDCLLYDSQHNTTKELIEEIEKNEKDFKSFKRIVFSLNCPKDDMFSIWKLEQKLMDKFPFRECIVTIQNNNLDEIQIYEV